MDIMDAEMNRFTPWDYAVFAATLIISVGIGLIFGCIGGKQKTTAEVLLGNRMMSLLPTSMSLLASFVSGVLFMGMTAEIYAHGTVMVWSLLGLVLAVVLSTNLYIPIFYSLKLTSVFEYLERRFNQSVRMIAVSIYIFQMSSFMAIVLYVPCLALSAVSGIQTWLAVLSVGLACMFYTAVGGMKAVMWTDTFQICIMAAGMLAVIIRGCLIMGFENIWHNAVESGRIDLFKWSLILNPNPQERHTAFGMILGSGLAWTGNYGVNQACVQRALAVPTLRRAKIAYWINWFGCVLFVLGAIFTGLILYSHYKHCDPVRSGRIAAADQMFIVYVMEVLGHLPGVPGLVVSAIFCGSLSTLSSGYNSLAAVVLTDILNPKFKMADERAALVSKGLAAAFGTLTIALAFVVAQLGSFFTQIVITTFGMIGGPLLGVFTVGIFYPWVNSKGAAAGLVASIAFTTWLGIGAIINPPYIHKYPVSTLGCNYTSPVPTNLISWMDIKNATTHSYSLADSYNTNSDGFDIYNSTRGPSTEEIISKSRSGIRGFYSVSYLWMAPLALLVCTIVSHLVSAATGFVSPADVDPFLISPVYKRLSLYLPKRWNCQLRSQSILSSGQNALSDEQDLAESKMTQGM